MGEEGLGFGGKFKQFENWYLNKKIRWEQAGISVDEAGLSKYGHQYWIKLL